MNHVDLNPRGIALWLRRRGPHMALELAVNIAAPALVYDRLHGSQGEMGALLASAVPPLLWTVAGFIRKRRVDAFSVLVMAGLALSVLALLGGGSAQMLQLREKLVTLVIALAFLGSAAIGRPLIYPLARATVARESAQALADFDARREDAMVRRTVMVMTLVWGFGLLADVVVSVALIYTLPVADYLVAGPVLFYATMGGLSLWTVLYRRHRTRQARRVPGA